MQIAPHGAKFLNEYEQPVGKHYVILGMSWAGWLFDFYDLMLFSFLTIPIQKSLGLSNAALSFIIGASLAAFFAVFTGVWVWTLPETRGTKITPD